jgi:hypothetical protein
MQQLKALGHDRRGQYRCAREVASRMVKARDKANCDRISTHVEDNRNCLGCCFSGNRCCRSIRNYDHGYPTPNQIGNQSWQPVVVLLRPTVLNRHVLALDVTGLCQTLAEVGDAEIRHHWAKRH